jgi:hypothetical protein
MNPRSTRQPSLQQINRGDRAARRRQRPSEPRSLSPIVRTARDRTDRPGDARRLRRAGPQLGTDARTGHPPLWGRGDAVGEHRHGQRHLWLIQRAIDAEPETTAGETPDTIGDERDTAAGEMPDTADHEPDNDPDESPDNADHELDNGAEEIPDNA